MKPWNGPFANTLTVGMLAFMLASPASAAFTYFSDEGLFNSAHSLPLTMDIRLASDTAFRERPG